MLIDSHCHLDSEDFDQDREGVITRAREAGLHRMLTVATSFSAWPKVHEIALQHEDIFCSVGLHPHEAQAEKTSLNEILDFVQKSKVVAIGETGLDYFYDLSPRPAQIENFRLHIEAAQRAELPLIVHTRDAEDDTISLLREAQTNGLPTLRGVIHCFSSARRLAEAALDIGFYISFSGMLTFKKSEEIRAIAQDVPLDRLLVETDAPYLAPVPLRGKTCEPSYVVHTARQLAALKGVSDAEIARQTSENFFRLFTKVPK